MSVRHIIFDCDGVLVDSEPLSMRADVEILGEHGIVLSEAEAHRRFVGRTFADMIAMMERETGRTLPPDLKTRKDRRLLEIYALELRPVPGVVAALEALDLPVSIASNSPTHRVVASLAMTGLTRFFGDRITTYEDVRHGKPAPDVFIEAARRAAVPCTDCLVVEDSVTGATAAVTAGCPTLGFTGTHRQREAQGSELRQHGVARVFDRMADLPRIVTEFL